MNRRPQREPVLAAMRRINGVWLSGKVDELGPMVDPDIVMVLPGFTQRVQGREEFLNGFRDFCENASVREFREFEHEADVVGATGVVSFRYEMDYERAGKRYRATGRDLWVFRSEGVSWIAVWRAMLDGAEAEII